MGMMQCDICGDNLTMDVSGEFALCDFCGLKYPRVRLMKKVSGIEGVDPQPAVQSQPVMSGSDIGFDDEPVVEAKPEPVVKPEPEPVAEPVAEPEPVVKPEPAAEPEPAAKPVEPAVQAAPIIGDVIPGLDDVPMEDESLTNTYDPFEDDMDGEEEEEANSGLTNAQKQELEKKNQRRQELQDELKEFEEMYENNKKAFFGEALKSKNYADMKIKEIKGKLEELEVEE